MRNKKIKTPLILLISSFVFAGCSNPSTSEVIIDYVKDKTESNAQFDYDGNYVAPELVIDGIEDDEQWENASEELVFGEKKQAKMKLYRGNEALFCFFTVSDPDLQTVGENNGDDVTKGDSVEVYFDFKNDASNKPTTDDIQINIGAHGKTRIFVGSNGQWGAWNGLLDYSIVLDGTLNNNKDVDKGYTVELMIPYSQVGITKDSTFGVTCGHVGRGTESTHDSLPYTWGGLILDNNFIDPQSPKLYVVSIGNNLYAKGKEPIGNIDISGKVVDINNDPIEGAIVKMGGKEVSTSSDGKYSFVQIDASTVSDIIVEKDGYSSYQDNILYSSLKTDSGQVNIDAYLLKNNESKTITLTGQVKNPIHDVMSDVTIACGDITTSSDLEGKFTISVVPSYDLSLTLTKSGYKDSKSKVDITSLLGKDTLDLGVLSLYSPSSNTVFGGERGTQLVNAEIYRGFDGINFLFKTQGAVTNGDKIELFIDTGYSFHGRDQTDYRIDLTGEGDIYIENYGSGTNNVPSTSGITNVSYLEGTTYYMEVMVPYSFLNIEKGDIIGVSFGIYDAGLLEWNGWGFAGTGFTDYVAPEYTDQYTRIGVDNLLYRSLSNDTVVNRLLLTIVDTNQNPITNAFVGSSQVSSDGTITVLVTEASYNLVISASGYQGVNETITSEMFINGVCNKTYELSKIEATIKITCNVEGAKVTLQSDSSVFGYVENGVCEIKVPTSSNARLVIEKDGYVSQTVAIAKNALVQSAELQTIVERTVTLVAVSE